MSRVTVSLPIPARGDYDPAVDVGVIDGPPRKATDSAVLARIEAKRAALHMLSKGLGLGHIPPDTPVRLGDGAAWRDPLAPEFLAAAVRAGIDEARREWASRK